MRKVEIFQLKETYRLVLAISWNFQDNILFYTYI